MPTLKDIAKETGVSVSTASRALRSMNSSSEVIQRVKEAAERLNYTPNFIAQGLVTKTTKTIGLVIPDITNPYFADLALGLETYLREINWTLILCNSDDYLEREELYIKSLISRRVEGIIIASTAIRNRKTNRIKDLTKSSECPVIAINSQPMRGLYTVQVDSEACGYIATKHLLDAGRKRIAYMVGSQTLWKSKKRVIGYQRALKEHGVKDAEICIEGGFRLDEASKSFGKLIDQGKSIDGIACESDVMAVGIINECRKRGIEVPGKIGVVGSGLTNLCRISTPSITSIGIDGNFLGKEVGKLIISAINGDVTPLYTSYEPQLRIMESSVIENAILN